jgi:hypothetical protein
LPCFGGETFRIKSARSHLWLRQKTTYISQLMTSSKDGEVNRLQLSKDLLGRALLSGADGQGVREASRGICFIIDDDGTWVLVLGMNVSFAPFDDVRMTVHFELHSPCKPYTRAPRLVNHARRSRPSLRRRERFPFLSCPSTAGAHAGRTEQSGGRTARTR